MYPVLDVINTLLETAVFLVILLDIRLYYNREKKQEVRDQQYLELQQKQMVLQQQMVFLLSKQNDVTEELIEEVIEIQPQQVEELDESNTDRNQLDREAGEVRSTNSSPDAPSGSGSVGEREILVGPVVS